MAKNCFEKYDLRNEPPFDDWVMSPSSVVKKESILDSLGLSSSDIPCQKAVVLHDDGSIRIEARIGNKTVDGWQIGDSYDVDNLLENEYFNRYDFGSDKTYVNFYFEAPDVWEPLLEKFN